jgi:hypothetical protein
MYHSPDSHLYATQTGRDGFMPLPGIGSSLGIAVPRTPVDCGPYSSTYPPGPQQQFAPSNSMFQTAAKYPDFSRYLILFFKFFSDFKQRFFLSSTSSSQMYNSGQSDFLQRSPMLGDVAPMDIPYKGFLPRADTRNKVCSSGLDMNGKYSEHKFQLASLKLRRQEIMMQIENMVCRENSETPSPSMVAQPAAV